MFQSRKIVEIEKRNSEKQKECEYGFGDRIHAADSGVSAPSHVIAARCVSLYIAGQRVITGVNTSLRLPFAGLTGFTTLRLLRCCTRRVLGSRGSSGSRCR